MKKEILDNLPDPRNISIPGYFNKTITEEKDRLNFSDIDINRGEKKLKNLYSKLKSGLNLAPPYSDNDVYVAYIDRYLKMYFPRMFFILNHLLKYTKFYEILKDWNSKPIPILDIGAGPGTMFMALLEYLEYVNRLETFNFEYELSIVEEEDNFLGFIRRFLDNLKISNPSLNSKLSLQIPLESNYLNFDEIETSFSSILQDSKFKIIIISFIINENKPDLERNKNLFRILSDHLEEDGLIIFIGAASDYIHNYFNIDFKKEMDLFRLVPCFNSNESYRTRSGDKHPFFGPCGDLCTFKISPTDRHTFSYLVLAKKDITFKKRKDMIENSVNFHDKYEYLARLGRGDRDKAMEEIIENCDIFGIFSDRRQPSYYICNGVCKYKVIDTTDNININEGDLVIFRDLKFDGVFPKWNRAKKPWIRKNYNEVGFKYHEDSSYEVISYFLEPGE